MDHWYRVQYDLVYVDGALSPDFVRFVLASDDEHAKLKAESEAYSRVEGCPIRNVDVTSCYVVERLTIQKIVSTGALLLGQQVWIVNSQPLPLTWAEFAVNLLERRNPHTNDQIAEWVGAEVLDSHRISEGDQGIYKQIHWVRGFPDRSFGYEDQVLKQFREWEEQGIDVQFQKESSRFAHWTG